MEQASGYPFCLGLSSRLHAWFQPWVFSGHEMGLLAGLCQCVRWESPPRSPFPSSDPFVLGRWSSPVKKVRSGWGRS